MFHFFKLVTITKSNLVKIRCWTRKVFNTLTHIYFNVFPMPYYQMYLLSNTKNREQNFVVISDWPTPFQASNYLLSVSNKNASLTYFKPMFHFCIPWQCQKSRGFLIFPGCKEMKYWLEKSYVCQISSKVKSNKNKMTPTETILPPLNTCGVKYVKCIVITQVETT